MFLFVSGSPDSDVPPDIAPLVRLPSGRHGLPRAYVARNQRQRITTAVAEAVSELGYVATTIEDIIQRAHVSRRTFYDHFSGKEDAFVAAYDGASEQLYRSIQETMAGQTGSRAKLTACLSAFLAFVEREPAFADMCIVEVLTAGPTALGRRDRVMRAFARLFHEAMTEGRPSAPDAAGLTAEATVGGVYEIVYKRVLRGQTADIDDLLPDLVCFCLLPYEGREAALAVYAEMRAELRGEHAAE